MRSGSVLAGDGTGVRLSPVAFQPQEQQEQRNQHPADAIDEEREIAADVPDQPGEVLPEETGDEGQRQEDGARIVSCSMVVFCRRLTFVCSTEITAMLASSTVPSRSRCAATSSLTSSRWSLTSRR